jgi:quinoprotein glucose dehydrogenase
MQVGGLAMHWGGVTPRFSPEDFKVRSLYGVGADWPISYEDLDPWYQEAEERLGVAGEQGPVELDPRGRPFPQAPLPLTYNLKAAPGVGRQIRHSDVEPAVGEEFRALPRPSGLLPQRHLLSGVPDRRQVLSRLHLGRAPQGGRVRLMSPHGRAPPSRRRADRRITRATAVDRASGQEVEFRARTFVVAGGYVWSSHLLLCSADARSPAARRIAPAWSASI